MAERSSTRTTPDLCYDLLFSRLKTEVLWTAVRLEVLDAVHELDPHADVSKIASRCKLAVSPTHRLLESCTALGLLIKQSEDSQDTYQTTQEVNDWLLRDSKTSLVDYVMFDYRSGTHFPSFVKHLEGDNDNKEGRCKFYEDLKAGDSKCKSLCGAMASVALTGSNLVTAFDLHKYQSAVDLAGGVGVIAAQVKKTYPHMEVSVIELPNTITEGKAWWKMRGGQPDFTFTKGDIFNGDLPEADLYIISHILSDWKEEDCLKLLTNVSKAVNPDGAILILDKTLSEIPNGDNPIAHLFDLKLMGNPMSGCLRTVQQHRDLLKTVGFDNMLFHEDEGCNLYDAMLATRK